jgi:hypothetical protein
MATKTQNSKSSVKSYSQAFFLKNLSSFIKYVMSNQILAMIILISVASLLTSLPFTIGLLFKFLLFVLAYKLAVDVLIETAHGHMHPGDYRNAVNASGLAIRFILVGVLHKAIVLWLSAMLQDPLVLITYLIVSTFISPAIFILISITESLSSALNPILIIKVIKPWFMTYLLFVLFWLGISFTQNFGIMPFALKHLPPAFATIVLKFFDVFFLVLNFHIMGFLIYQNRKTLQFDAAYEHEVVSDESPELILSTEANPIHERIKQLLVQGEITEAFNIIYELKANGDKSGQLLSLFYDAKDLLQKKDKQHISESVQIHALLEDNKTTRALKLYTDMFHNNNPYTESCGEDLTRLAKEAFSSEKYKLVIRLLKNFHKKYPQHKDVVRNYFLIAQVLYNNPQTIDKSKSLLMKIIKLYPKHPLIPQISSWLKGIDLMKSKVYNSGDSILF